MVELIQTEVESQLRKCPTCKMTCTFIEFECLRENEQGDIKSDTFYRCLKCLGLFKQELEEVKG